MSFNPIITATPNVEISIPGTSTVVKKFRLGEVPEWVHIVEFTVKEYDTNNPLMGKVKETKLSYRINLDNFVLFFDDYSVAEKYYDYLTVIKEGEIFDHFPELKL